MNKWKSIWDKKSLDTLDLKRSEFEIFCDLKRADGFDVNVSDQEAYYRSFYEEWEKMYRILQSLAQGTVNSVYEVGCGSGVNLFLFQNRLENGSLLGGIDYSANLLEIAGKVVKSADFTNDEAMNINTDEKYDLVMAESVFQYFESVEYAEKVLRKMLCKADKLVYIGELHDSGLKDEWLENRRKSMENYDEIYAGLPKMFYSRTWVSDIAKEFGRQVRFTTWDNPEYWNSRYIFNCYIY